MSEDFTRNLSNGDNWLKALLIAVYALIFYVAACVLGLVVIAGVLVLLITGERNANLSDFGRRIARYLADIMAFATLTSEQRPFPFGEWPEDDGDEVPAAGPAAPAPAKPPEAPEPVPVAAAKPAAEPAPPASSGQTASKKATRKKASKKTAARKTTKKAAGKKRTRKAATGKQASATPPPPAPESGDEGGDS